MMNGKLILIGSNKCPVCGKEFTAEPPLKPNTEDREFYGGRIKFFKEVECDCRARYNLCIEKRFNSLTTNEELRVINMILLHEGKPLDEVRKEELEERRAKEKAEVLAKIEEKEKQKEERNTLEIRNELKKQRILATIIDKDEKLNTLLMHTTHELQMMCKKRKLKYAVRWGKQELAETLLAYDPNMVVAGPKD